jgi:putative ABC transport system permease protein
MLASTFFAAIIVKADSAARQVMEEQLVGVYTDMTFSGQFNYSHPARAAEYVLGVEGVTDVEFFYKAYQPSLLPNVNSTDPSSIQFAALPNSTTLYDDMIGIPEDGIGENETYVLTNSPLADELEVGDFIQTGFQFRSNKYENVTTFYVNMTVAGFVELPDEAYSKVSGNIFYISPIVDVGYPGQSFGFRNDLLFVSWEATIEKLWSQLPDMALPTDFLVSVDYDMLLSPWDSQGSVNNIQKVGENIRNTILGNLEHSVTVQSHNLEFAVQTFQYNYPTILISFIAVSIPVIIVAWYIGSTVCDVSFNLRRREIGLLSTRGLSSGQIQRMFFTEALLIGLVGGLAGVVGGALLNQVYTGFNLETLINSQTFNHYVVSFTVIFGVGLAFFSVFFSARRATSLPAVDALKEYMSIDSVKPHRKRLPWVAFILGAFKVVLFLLGFDLVEFLSSAANAGGGNYLVYLLLTPLELFDLFLTFFSPLFFFWGFTKLFVQNSLKFQQLSSKVSKVTGDLGALASKNVRRNPARTAAVAFLIALVIGYGVQVTVQLASEQDYVVRKVQYDVGADIVVSVVNATEAQTVLDDIVGNISEIQYSTMECILEQPVRRHVRTEIRTVDPDSWLETAYYESPLFSGASVEEAFNQLNNDNMTIILERRVAQELDLKIGDVIAIDFQSGARKLRIIALFGPEPAELPSGNEYTLETWSFVPRNLFNMSSPFSDAYIMEEFQTNILLKLNDGVNGTRVAEKIRDLDLEIYGVISLDEEMTDALESDYSLQIMDVQRLGLIFSVLAASVGIALVSIVSMRERNREATLMSVKGLSYRQLVWMFLTENIAVVVFSVVLGVIVGLIAGYGNIISSSGVISELVERHLVFTYDSFVAVASCIALIFASTLVPIMVMSRQYVTKLERMIRIR